MSGYVDENPIIVEGLISRWEKGNEGMVNFWPRSPMTEDMPGEDEEAKYVPLYDPKKMIDDFNGVKVPDKPTKAKVTFSRPAYGIITAWEEIERYSDEPV